MALVKKYELTPEETEKKFISNERFRTIFNMHRTERTKLIHDIRNRYDKKKYDQKKKKKMREKLKIDEKVLVLAEKIRKKSAPGKFYSLFKIYLSLTKRKYFSLEKSKKIDKISYYWLKDSQNKKLTKRF